MTGGNLGGRRETKRALACLDENGFDETRAWDALQQVLVYARKEDELLGLLSNVFRVVGLYLNGDCEKDRVGEAVEEFAKDLCTGDYELCITPFEKPIFYDGLYSAILLSGPEIYRNGGKTASVRDFMNQRGIEVVQRFKVELLQGLHRWKTEQENGK